MKITFDKEADATYIYLKEKIEDREDKLIGIEVLNANKNLAKLPEKVVA